jgi:[protein-PII] uridylyltransferase
MIRLSNVGDGVRAALARTSEADKQLRKLLSPFHNDSKDLLILATGGYGRCDISLHSDLDLIIFHKGNISRHEEKIQTLVTGLWDRGWHPGQTLVSHNEINESLLAIPDRASALLEARYVWGDRKLADHFDHLINRRFTQKAWEKFVQLKREEFELRREKFGNVAKVIELHLKSQVGGMRDIHHVLWLERARAAYNNRWKLRRKRGSEISSFMSRMKNSRLINALESDELIEAYDFILRLRETLRQHSNRPEDILHVVDQVNVGRNLGIDGSEKHVMQSVMFEAYISAEKIARFADEFGPFLEEYELKRKPKVYVISEIHGAKRSRKRIKLTHSAIKRISKSPKELLQLVDYSVINSLPLSGQTRHDLRRELDDNTAIIEKSTEWNSGLIEWFNLKRNLSKRLRTLDELDAIHMWLPEWWEIVSLTFGSYYHQFSVDEHTLRTIEKLDTLPDDGPEGLPASLWRNFDERLVVYLSLLLHDIAKGRRAEHSREGAKIARDAVLRLGLSDETSLLISKLVSIHLRMEQFAFRRDFKDPVVVASFARIVGDQNTLEALYLLTICDLRAVSRHVWTKWKGQLLAELFIETREWFIRGHKAKDVTVQEELKRVSPFVDDKQAISRTKDFLEEMREEYRRVIPAEEIAQHFVVVEDVINEKTVFKWITDEKQGFLVLTLITHDRVGLLSQITGLLVSLGIGIREARIFTRSDGIIVDRFRAEDIEPKGIPLDERLGRINDLWQSIEAGEVDLKELITRFKRRRRFDSTPRTVTQSEISITPSNEDYLIDVSGPESVGLLNRLCFRLAKSGLDIKAARVSRRVDGIIDAFLVRDPNDYLIDEKNRKELIKLLEESIYDVD